MPTYNLKLSKNFWLSEFTISQTAQRLGIENIPLPDHVDNLKLLCRHILQPLRDRMRRAIFISSGYRSPALNSFIGGSGTSDHRYGRAADIDSPTDNIKYFNFIKSNLIFDQLIWEFGNDEYPGWIHVSFRRGENRNQILKAYRDQHGIHYKEI